jgi:hypothetical protein
VNASESVQVIGRSADGQLVVPCLRVLIRHQSDVET